MKTVLKLVTGRTTIPKYGMKPPMVISDTEEFFKLLEHQGFKVMDVDSTESILIGKSFNLKYFDNKEVTPDEKELEEAENEIKNMIADDETPPSDKGMLQQIIDENGKTDVDPSKDIQEEQLPLKLQEEEIQEEQQRNLTISEEELKNLSTDSLNDLILKMAKEQFTGVSEETVEDVKAPDDDLLGPRCDSYVVEKEEVIEEEKQKESKPAAKKGGRKPANNKKPAAKSSKPVNKRTTGK